MFFEKTKNTSDNLIKPNPPQEDSVAMAWQPKSSKKCARCAQRMNNGASCELCPLCLLFWHDNCNSEILDYVNDYEGLKDLEYRYKDSLPSLRALPKWMNAFILAEHAEQRVQRTASSWSNRQVSIVFQPCSIFKCHLCCNCVSESDYLYISIHVDV